MLDSSEINNNQHCINGRFRIYQRCYCCKKSHRSLKVKISCKNITLVKIMFKKGLFGQAYHMIISFINNCPLYCDCWAFAQLCCTYSCFRLHPPPFHKQKGACVVTLQSIQGHVCSRVYNGDDFSLLQCAASWMVTGCCPLIMRCSADLTVWHLEDTHTWTALQAHVSQ